MTHLRETEFVDLLDGTLPPVRMAHLHGCEACRATAEAARAALVAAVSENPASEPSPLFWEHFARRVNQAIDAPAAPAGWFTAPRLALATLATLTVLLLAMTLVTSRAVPDPAQPAPATAAVAEPDDLDADADWAIVRAAADDLDLDDAQAAGLVARPGTADRMALELTAAERAELIRLLQAEFKSGA